MIYVYATMLTLLNMVFWVSIIFNLPGTWLMVLVSALVEWWQPGTFMYSWTVLFVAGGLAVLGEVIEFALGAVGSRHAGGSPRGAALAIIGSIIGGILGTIATGADCGHSHRRLPRSLRRLCGGRLMGRSAAVSKRQSGSGGGRGPVLGDDSRS